MNRSCECGYSDCGICGPFIESFSAPRPLGVTRPTSTDHLKLADEAAASCSLDYWDLIKRLEQAVRELVRENTEAEADVALHKVALRGASEERDEARTQCYAAMKNRGIEAEGANKARDLLKGCAEELHCRTTERDEARAEVESYKRQVQEYFEKLQGTDALLAESVAEAGVLRTVVLRHDPDWGQGGG